MGFLGKGDKAKTRSNHTTVVAEGTRFSGELKLEANLHVDGRIEGGIVCDNDISVGRNGEIDGDIKADHIVISGQVKGRVECDRIEIMSSGRVFAEVTSRDFVVEPGAQFVGENRLKQDHPPKALSYLEPEAAPAPSDAAPDAGPGSVAPSK
jgi:cytoskeletal protein CcmA (bactofilin family)